LNLKKFSQFCLLIVVAAVGAGLISATAIDRHSGLPILPELQQLSTPTTDLAWGETGATVLPVAAQIMAMRNLGGVELNKAQKGYLRPLFGNLVDRITVQYQAKLLDRWEQDGQETHIGEIDSAAQTYCRRIYLRDAYKSGDTEQVALIAHEMTHSQQCDRVGGIGKFGFDYFQGYYRGGKNYQNNPLEKSARSMETKFARQLCQQVSCPPKSGRFYVNYKGSGIKVPVKIDT
jgi:Domain of unknown function (DUF4157)